MPVVSRTFIVKSSRYSSARSRFLMARHSPRGYCCDNIIPTTVPTMYMAQPEKLRWVLLVELNMKYSPRSAIPKLPTIATFTA
jgi:hypothetical protein